MTAITWGAPGLDLLIMSSADKRRGGSSATTPKSTRSGTRRTVQQPKNTKKGAPVVKRPQQ